MAPAPARKIQNLGSRSEATRTAILEAALGAFCARGFDGASLGQIARRARVHAPQLSYHFGSKLDLWKATVDCAFGRFRAEIDSLVSEAEADREPERRILRGFVRLVARNPDFVQLMLDEGKRSGPRMRWLVDRHVRPAYTILERLFRSAQAAGRFPADLPVANAHYILLGAVTVIFHQAAECRRVTGVDPFLDESIETHARSLELLFFGAGEPRVA